MKLTVAQASNLAQRALVAAGYDEEEATLVTEHIIDTELRGLDYGGLARVVSIFERTTNPGYERAPIEVVHETPSSALVDGHNTLGYLVARRASDLCIDKASEHGMSVVGARDTWHTGMLSFFAEMAAERDLVTLIASNASPNTAPHGGSEGRFGTNPICFGFPSSDDPVIWDIGTSNIMHGEVVLAQRLGEQIPEGTAYDAAGNPTRDPTAALAGAFTAWGGHKGSGLAMAVQLLGTMCNVAPIPQGMFGYGCLFVMMRADLLMPAQEYKDNVSLYAAEVRKTRPVHGGPAVRMPYDRSLAERRRRIAADEIEISDEIHTQISELAQRNSPATGGG
ncbi:MAG: delta1-piperideine-2-carboxylate reductase [Gammaproteobacteria bacterium]|jgi:delta1-piperideine-2-carboxylate reductase